YLVFRIFQPNSNRLASGYLQAFREGQLESVSTYALRTPEEKRWFYFSRFEKTLIERTGTYLQYMRSQDISPPIMVRVGLVDVLHYGMNYNTAQAEEQPLPLRFIENIVVPPGLLLHEWDQVSKPDTFLQPLINMVWNACGWERSPSYDENGNWRDLSKQGQ